MAQHQPYSGIPGSPLGLARRPPKESHGPYRRSTFSCHKSGCNKHALGNSEAMQDAIIIVSVLLGISATLSLGNSIVTDATRCQSKGGSPLPCMLIRLMAIAKKAVHVLPSSNSLFFHMVWGLTFPQ